MQTKRTQLSSLFHREYLDVWLLSSSVYGKDNVMHVVNEMTTVTYVTT